MLLSVVYIDEYGMSDSDLSSVQDSSREISSTPPTSDATYEWFSKPKEVQKNLRLLVLLRTLIGLVVASGLWIVGWHTLAYVGAGLAVVLGVVMSVSASLAHQIERALNTFGVLIGRLIAVITLTPIYLTIFPLIRGFDLLARRDPMGRTRASSLVTYWRPADDAVRVKAGVKRSFVTESLLTRQRGGWISIAGLALIALIGAELGLRWFGFGDPVLYRGDVNYGYLPAPNQRVTRRGNIISINEWGMRAPQQLKTKPAGVTRVLILGDSTLWGGSYMPQDQIYARLLEGHLNQNVISPQSRVEVLNVGVNGWGPEHKLGYLETFGDFDADIAIIAFPYADLMRPISYLSMTPFYPAHSPPYFALQEVLYHLSWRIRGQLIGRPSNAQRERALKRGLEVYAELARALQRRGVELWFEMLPSRRSVEAEPSSKEQRLVAAIKDRLSQLPFSVRFHFADSELAQVFTKNKRDHDNYTLYHDPGHLNLQGHQAYAQYLAQRLLTSPTLKALYRTRSEELHHE